jgi:transposase
VRGAPAARALKGVHDSDPDGQEWAECMANTLLIAKRMMEQAATAGHTRLSDEQVSFIRAAYAGAISTGRHANAARPDTKAAKLVERFARDAADILRFTTDTAIWFSNNQSERDLRPTKLQQKISGTWRLTTLQGLADFATLRSYLSTATKHGMDLLTVLQQLFTTGPWLPPDPGHDLKLNTYRASADGREINLVGWVTFDCQLTVFLPSVASVLLKRRVGTRGGCLWVPRHETGRDQAR